MSRKPDFDSLEDWADRKLKQLGSPAAPSDFLADVMQKVHDDPVAYVAAENPSAMLIWLRYGVVIASTCLLVVVMLFDASWVAHWWDQSWLANAYSIGSHLFLGGRQIVVSLAGMIPAFVWVGMGVSILAAYGMLALTGGFLVHFTLKRTRIHAA